MKGYYYQTISEVQAELEQYAKEERKREKNTKPISNRCWTFDAYGVADCKGSSFAIIFDAYQDYKDTCYSKMYDNY